MRRVLKWVVPIDDQYHEVGGGPVLHVNMKDGFLCVWTDEDDSRSRKQARVFGTGHPVPDGLLHLGSCVDGPFAWHLFAVQPLVPSGSEIAAAFLRNGSRVPGE